MPSTFKILTYRQFEPTEISGLKAWYDASTLTGTDGSAVSQWLDSSGNQAHMFQPSATAQPTLQTSELNGRNVVRFDGSNDLMNMTTPFPERMNTIANHDAVEYSPDGNYLVAIGHNISPYFYIYKKDSNEIWNKLPNPSVLPTSICQGVAWSRSGDYLAVCSNASPFILIYKRSGDTFTKLADPTTLPTGFGFGATWSGYDEFLAVSHGTSRFITIYQRSGDTFTKLADPAILPTGTGTCCKFSPDSNFLAVGSNASPFILIYSRSGSAFTKTTNPTILPSSQPDAIDWLNDSTQFICTDNIQNYVRLYENIAGTFQQNTTINIGSQSRDLAFTANASYLAVAHAASPFFSVFSRSGNVYTKLNDPTTIPSSTGRGVTWNSSGNRLSVASNSTTAPNLDEYIFESNTLTSRGKLNMLRNVSATSIFAVVKYNIVAIAQTAVIVTTGASAVLGRAAVGVTSGGTFRNYGRRLDADAFGSVSATSTTSAAYVIQSGILDYANSNINIYLNGLLNNTNLSFQTDGLTSNTDSYGIRLGSLQSSEFMNGDIAEILVFDRALTAIEISNVHEYLSRKWGITLA